MALVAFVERYVTGERCRPYLLDQALVAFVERYVTGRILVGQKYTSSGGVVVYFSNILKPRIFSIEIWELFIILSSINLDWNNL